MKKLARQTRLQKSLLCVTGVILVCGVPCLYHPFRREVRVAAQTGIAHVYATPNGPFPAIATDNLTPLQRRIVAISAREYAKKPVSYDSTVLTYTQSVSEPWCADFASWVFMQAGQPFSNPDSGSWRIPGVYTLQAYFQSQHRWQPAGSYVPETGDVAIYSTGEGHTNIVLGAHDGHMVTIGGNETGHVRIETQSYAKGAQDLIGFGTLKG